MRSGVDPFAFAEAIGERIDAVHCCDCRMEDGRVRYLLPPYGGFDFKGLIGALQKKGFDGDVLLEVYSDMYDGLPQLRDSFYAFEKSLL